MPLTVPLSCGPGCHRKSVAEILQWSKGDPFFFGFLRLSDIGGAPCAVPALFEKYAILDPSSPMAEVTQYLLCSHTQD